MRTSELIEAMESIAPLEYAEPWDRAGLQVGERSREIDGPVMLTIDLTERVLAEATDLGAGAIIAYHCPIWEPLTSLTDATPIERIVRGAIEAGIAIYSPHTALDAAPGGVTDWLCEGLSGGDQRVAGDCRALTPHMAHPNSREVKIVTFVPEGSLDTIRGALATAGAGGIGLYRVCSFASPGIGTFLPSDDANPTIGQAGTLSKVNEHRLEMVCSRRALPIAIETLREFHPYEEPAFDVFELVGEPHRAIGAGRRLILDQPATADELGGRLKSFLDRSRVRVVLHGERDRAYKSIGVVPGAGADLLENAIREGCDLFVTGEMRHHEIVAALHRGISIMLAGHTNTERGYLPRLASRLASLRPDATFVVSDADDDILSTI